MYQSQKTHLYQYLTMTLMTDNQAANQEDASEHVGHWKG